MRERLRRPSEFFFAGIGLGFSASEVSGLRCDDFYEEIHPGRFNIISFHNPAPIRRGKVWLSGKATRQADQVLTSLDKELRRQAVAAVLRTLDVAAEYGAQAVVIHSVQPFDPLRGEGALIAQLKDRLERLFLQGQIAGSEANRVRSRLMEERKRHRGKHMTALRRSLDELIPYAAARGVRLGVENRPIDETPNFEDMGEVLGWYPGQADTIGYWHDTGHAQVQADLGFTPHVDWLRAYGSRLVGLHLHDAINLEVHRAPGAGSVDWAGLSSYVLGYALCVVEPNHTVSEEALRAGMRHLQFTGWA